MRSGNPALGQNTFLDIGSGRVVGDQAMTINGTVNKTALMLVILLASAAWTWSKYTGPESLGAVMPMVWTGAIGGFIVALATVFKKTWSPVTAPICSQ